MGWVLSGLELETGSTRVSLPDPAPGHLAQMESVVSGLMNEHGVRRIGLDGLRDVQALAARENVYLIDVRAEDEYTRGHIPGFWWMPGGQAVQRSDDTVAVRDGHIVFACDGIVRAGMTAVWYRQMGFPNVYVVDGGTQAWRDAGQSLESGAPDEHPIGYERARSRVQMLGPQQAQATIAKLSPLVLFVDTSARYDQGHLPGSYWLPRGWLELKIAALAPEQDTPIIVTCADGIQSALAAVTLREMGYPSVAAIDGGIAAWRNAGLPLETGLTNLTVEARDDVRAGAARTRDEMLYYLSWEEELGRKYERKL
jgi:rhodanese-related sulfurtransferase